MPTRSAKLSERLPCWLDNIIKPRRKRTAYAKYETRVRLCLVPMLGPGALSQPETLGHSQIPVTMNVYTHVIQDTQRKAVNHPDRMLKWRPGRG